MMINNYFRPTTLQEALLLKAENKNSRYMGGGLTFVHCDEDVVAIDLQLLNLDKVTVKKIYTIVGATSTLEKVGAQLSNHQGLKKAITLEASKNIRNVATIGGLVKTKNSRSPFLNCLNSIKTIVHLEPGDIREDLNDFIHLSDKNNSLITSFEIKLPQEIVFDYVSRSPMDIPIISVAISEYDDELRLSCGGFKGGPYLFSVDSPERIDIDDITKQIGIKDDEWASAAYKKSSLEKLILRNIAD